MTQFSDTKTHLQRPLTAHRHNDVESLSQTADAQATAGNNICLSKPDETNRRPTLRRIVSGSVYPEGGRQAWLVVLGCFCGMMASFGFMATSKPHDDWH
jgi:hypothetical protein